MLNLQIDDQALEKSFDSIAIDLFQNYDLKVGANYYALAELEFYYNKFAKDHPLDIFAHQHDAKYPNGTWRLHGAGLDITLKKEDDYYGGILIRGLQELQADRIHKTDTYIDGPWNVATTCIRQMGKVDNNNGFVLLQRVVPRAVQLQKAPRVGLQLRKAQDLKYLCKAWRYLTTPVQSKKYRHFIYLQQRYEQGAAIANQHWSKLYNKEQYWKEFIAVQTMSPQSFVNLKLTVNNTCRMFGCYTKNYLEKSK